MKRYIAAITALITINACTATSATATSNIILKPINQVTSMVNHAPPSLLGLLKIKTEQQTLLQRQVEEHEAQKAVEATRHRALVANEIALKERLKDLEKQVGVTWYVFSGSTPRGWDCSGMTRWFYEGLGIEIPHSANKQSKEGTKVLEPKIGDIVLYDYQNNAKMYDHAGIYIGDGKMIHAGGKKGDRTEIVDVVGYAPDAKIVYIRILDTPE